MNGHWRIVLPVKGSDRAKSRLAVTNPLARPLLARSMALDTLAAALSCPRVDLAVVVTSDPDVTGSAEDLGAVVAADRSEGRGLNAAITAALARPDLRAARVAVLLADVPALTADALAEALDRCEEHPAAFVPDAEGTGTVLLAAERADLLPLSFGRDSAARHEVAAVRLDLDLPGLRRDVDTIETLAEAVALGVGARTRAALAAAG